MYGGTDICDQPLLQYPLFQPYVILGCHRKLVFLSFLPFHCHSGIPVSGGFLSHERSYELYLLDCFHSIVHGSLIGGSMMFYESIRGYKL